MAEKVRLVEGLGRKSDLGAALSCVGLARSTWYYRQRVSVPYEARYAVFRAPLERIARKHPEYGYRRTTTELREAEGVVVNQKVVRKLNQLWGLPLLRQAAPPRPSAIRKVIVEAGGKANLVASLNEIGVFEVIYTDFTELEYANGKAWLMVLLDHCCKVVAGWALGANADTELALIAWRRARSWMRRRDIDLAGLIVHHDRDSVYTSYDWTNQLLLRDKVRISYALNGCRDNPEMESFHSRFKSENRSLFLDASSLADLRRIVKQRISYYNSRRRHSSLGNGIPLQYLSGLLPEG